MVGFEHKLVQVVVPSMVVPNPGNPVLFYCSCGSSFISQEKLIQHIQSINMANGIYVFGRK